MDPRKDGSISRRRFVQTTAAVSVAAGGFPYIASGALKSGPIKVGLIGCGGRGAGGNGAIFNCVAADDAVRITALADVFQDRLDAARNRLKGKTGQTVEDKNCFIGFDAYQKLLETDVDIVILATPPYFRPEHLAACIKAGKNVFTEKPVAVDAPGIRSVMASGEKAKSKGLAIVAGTQRRHQKPYIETIKRIRHGAIGDIVSAQCYWNMGQLWFKPRQGGWDGMAWMIRDWVNWAWLSGDHVVEQHVHNLDVINWVIGEHVESVVALGGRQRRVTGDQFDFFSADLTFPGQVHVHSMCRQITGCENNVSERVIGTKGVSNCMELEGFKPERGRDPYEQEHVDLIASIRNEKPLNEAKNVAISNMTAIMIRDSAYTGKKVTWDEAIASEERIGPSHCHWGEFAELLARAGNPPVPGVAPKSKRRRA